MLQKSTIKAIQFPEWVEPDYIGIEPEDLPYEA